MKSHVTYFSLITCIIIVTKRKNLYLYIHNTPDTKCVGFPYQSIFQVSLVSPQLDILQFNYDTNCWQLAQAPRLRNQSHKAAPSFRHQSQAVGPGFDLTTDWGSCDPFPRFSNLL